MKYAHKLTLEHAQYCISRNLPAEVVQQLADDGTLSSVDIRSGFFAKESHVPNFPDLVNRGNGYFEAVGKGILMKFTDDFYQLKPDESFELNGKTIKYMSPSGVSAKAFLPPGCKVITEGLFDALAGTHHGGIVTGAIAGVSHCLKALWEGHKKTIIFDSDGWSNPQIIRALYIAAKHGNSKVQLVPVIAGHPKAGLEEYFRYGGGTPETYKQLIDSAYKPLELLYEAVRRISKTNPRKVEFLTVCVVAAAQFEKDADTWQILDDGCKSAGIGSKPKKLIAATVERAIQNRVKEQQAKKQAVSVIEKPKLKEPSPYHHEAVTLLDSGKLLNEIETFVQQAGVIKLEAHIKLGLTAVVSILIDEDANSLKWLGATGLGKSVSQDIVAALLPPENVEVIDYISPAGIRRKADAWKNKLLVIDEEGTVMSDPFSTLIFKTLISKGYFKSEIPIPNKDKGFDLEPLCIEGPVAVSMCSTEQTQEETYGAHQDEMSNRVIEINPPNSPEYNRAVNTAILLGKKIKKLQDVDAHKLEVIREAIRIAMSRPRPTVPAEFGQALVKLAQIDDPLSRILNAVMALLKNCSALLGKSEVGLEAYEVIYPLLSVILQTKVSASNPKTLEWLKQIAKHLNSSQKYPNLATATFDKAVVEEATKCQSRTATTRVTELKKADWAKLSDIPGKQYQYCFTEKGLWALNNGVVLTEVLPHPKKLRNALACNKYATSMQISENGCNLDGERASAPNSATSMQGTLHSSNPYIVRDIVDIDTNYASKKENVVSEKNSPDGAMGDNEKNNLPGTPEKACIDTPKSTSNSYPEQDSAVARPLHTSYIVSNNIASNDYSPPATTWKPNRKIT